KPSAAQATVTASGAEAYALLADQPCLDAADPLGFDAAARDLAHLIIRSRDSTPFALGIDGGWGTGKSSLMRRLCIELEGRTDDSDKRKEERRASVWGWIKSGDSGRDRSRGFTTVWFNAWSVGNGSALEGLIKTVLSQVDANVLRRVLRRRKV